MNNQQQIPKIFCKMCGGQIDWDSKFCPLCGKKLVDSPTAAPVDGMAANNTHATYEPWSRNVLMVTYDDRPASRALRTDKEKASIKTIVFANSFNDRPFYNSWDVSEGSNERVAAWTMLRKDSYYDLYIAGEGGVSANSNSRYLFSGFSNLERIIFHSHFHTANVTNMHSMFFGCNSLTTIDLSNFSTSQVTDMSDMFRNCKNLTHLDISGFDISNTTEVGYMFSGCDRLTDLKIGNLTPEQINAMRIPEGVNIYH